jgi:hypothetical protein
MLLGVWQTGGLPPGEYTLRLSVTTASGATGEAMQLVAIEGQ